MSMHLQVRFVLRHAVKPDLRPYYTLDSELPLSKSGTYGP